MHGGGGGQGGNHGLAHDEVMGKIYDARLFKKMIRYLKPFFGLVLVSFLILMVATAVELILPLITKTAVDEYIVSSKALLSFGDEASWKQFHQKYPKLKIPSYQWENKYYSILPTKQRRFITYDDRQKLEQDNMLSTSNYYLIPVKGNNLQIVDSLAASTTYKLRYTRIAPEWLAISQPEMKRVPKAIRSSLRKDASKRLEFYGMLFFIAILIRLITNFFQVVLTSIFSQRAMRNLRMDLFKHLQKMPISFFDKNPVGRLVTRVTNDIAALDEMLSSGMITLIQDIILIIALVVIMLLLNWKLALVSFIVLPFVVITINIFKTKTRPVYRDTRKKLAELNATLAEHISGVKIIQLFNQYFSKKQQFVRIYEEYYDISLRQLKLFAFFRPLINLSSQFAIGLIIWYGGGQILHNVITIGMFMAFTTYIGKLFEPINDFSDKFNILQGALAASERIFDLLETPHEDYRNDLQQAAKLQGEIEFRNVSMAYNDNEWILKNVSFHVKPGEKVALVGHTGSGKTTIVNLILGMYPYQKGQILLDGKELSEYAVHDIRNNIGMVQQDVFLFAGTIRDNIVLNNTAISDEEMKRVADYVNVRNFIESLPGKFNEPVMERGSTFSVGQRQLISFARVLAYDPSIFILDEATSNIDTETEFLIQDALEKLMQNRTSMVIAHRLSTIQHADRIIVLHKGEIVEEGNHQELLQKGGLYYDLYRLQYA
jgi:ATP-binding cassette subfamily B protein/subfamily B ATP-binding cassette protein MsbA